jgi:branched-chain amino acid transport system substrate-binding protein
MTTSKKFIKNGVPHIIVTKTRRSEKMKNEKMKKISGMFVVGVLALSLLSFSGCLSQEEEAVETPAPTTEPVSAEPVLFCQVIEMTGLGSSCGIPWTQAVSMAVEEINSAGGILGRPIEIHTYDTATDPATSKSAMLKAVSENPFAILGTIFSSSTLVNMEVTQEAKIPQFCGSTNPTITEQGHEYIFRTSTQSATAMPQIVKWAVEEGGIKTAVVVYQSDDYGMGCYDRWAIAMDDYGAEIVQEVVVEPGQVDFSAEVVQVESVEADALFVFVTEEMTAYFLRDYRKIGGEKQVYGDTPQVSPIITELVGEDHDGTIGLLVFVGCEGADRFAEKFKQKWGIMPDHNAMKGYMAVYIIKTVVELIGEFDQAKFVEFLHGGRLTEDMEPHFLVPELVYGTNGDMFQTSFIVQIQSGEQVIIDILPPEVPEELR